MRDMKRLSIVWGILAVLIFGALTAYGFFFIKQREDYKKLEEEIENLAHNKIEQEGLYDEVKKKGEMTFKTDELTDDDLEAKGEKCTGYVVVKYDSIYEYEGFIECENYKTSGYDK